MMRTLLRQNATGCACALTLGLTFPLWGRYAAAALYALWLIGGPQ